MDNPYQSSETKAADSAEWSVRVNGQADEVATVVAEYFESQGYRLESGTPTDGQYGIGSNLMRIFFGAFVKRYRFNIRIEQQSGGSLLQIEKGMSGIAGGAIGYSKMNSELNRVRGDIQNLLSVN